MRLRIRARKVLLWGMVLLVASLAGAAWFAFTLLTDSDTMAGLIKAQVVRYVPGGALEIGRVRPSLIKGEFILSQVALRQTLDGAPFVTGRVPWLRVLFDARALVEGRFVPRQVVIAQPTLRLRRRRDGTWNLQGLLADPWPGLPMERTPPILVQNGTVELADDADATATAAVLREVTLKIESAGRGRLQFEATAKGGAFDRLGVQGVVDVTTGRVELKGGDVARLALSESLFKRLPLEQQKVARRVGLTGGELDLLHLQLSYDPHASPPIHYGVTGRLRAGSWNCPHLPFPINDVSGGFSARDGVLTFEGAQGSNGSTSVRAGGTINLRDPARAPLEMRIDGIDLDLDKRLEAWTVAYAPRDFAEIWNDFRPSGRVSAAIHVVRAREGGPVGLAWTVDCRDVAMRYRYFQYPLDHVQGKLTFAKDQIGVDLRTLVGGKPLGARGTIDHPGPDALVHLDFEAEDLPVDKTLLDAMPPDVRKVVNEFHPSGSVRGRAHLERTPVPGGPPEGDVKIDATLDLNERCEITWVGMPYPVRNLTGRLKIHPDAWEFENMRGRNGQAIIKGSCRVVMVARDQPRVQLDLSAENLPFNDELRRSLQPAWQKTWAILNPSGSCDVEAAIAIEPGRPDHYRLEIVPRPGSSVRLTPGGSIDLRMEEVTGRLVFDNGPRAKAAARQALGAFGLGPQPAWTNGAVALHDVGFIFHDAPVKLASGTVVVEDTGQFQLGVRELSAENFRLDQRLRDDMPPLMAQFARRLDDGRTVVLKGNLGLGWSGQAGRPVVCRWSDALVVLNDKTIQAGLPLEHTQGQLDHVRGWTEGEAFEVHGVVSLESVNLLGQQITRLESPFEVARGWAQLPNLRGRLLGGELDGRVQVKLDATPQYRASLNVRGADLQHYAKTLPGRQTYRGLVFARLDLSGQGHEPRTLQGSGEAHITQGDLGELPVALRLVSFLNSLAPRPIPRTAPKTAFDSADVGIVIRNGEAYLDPIKFTGNAFSLQGRGKLDVQHELDLRLKVLYGRDRMHLPVVSDALREASGQIFLVRVTGTPANPRFKLEPLPIFRTIADPIAGREDR